MEEIAKALHLMAKMRHDIDFEMFKEAYEEVRGHKLETDYLMEMFSSWQNNTISWSIHVKDELTELLDALWRRMPLRRGRYVDEDEDLQ
tara:strand:- start:1404 stop:1670 length:267 start_codon:yes stop_codon:yes gene_type:complete